MDATGPLAFLWVVEEKARKCKQDLNPDDIIDIAKLALVLLVNAHEVYMTDRCKALLGRLLPECLDLLDDRDGKKALLKDSSF